MVAYRLPFLSKSEVAIHLAYTNVNYRFLFLSFVTLVSGLLLNYKHEQAEETVCTIGKIL